MNKLMNLWPRPVAMLLLALLMVSLVAAACGGGEEGAPGEPQVFRAHMAGEPDKIDPNRAAFSQEITVIKQLFNGLLGFNQDLTLKPVAAEVTPSTGNGGISSDGLTYTFKLRKEVTWSDGPPVTAKDYVYSIKRMLDPAIAADYASFYYSIVNAEEYNGAGKKDAAEQAKLKGGVGVRAVNDLTLEIKLKAPEPTFLTKMAMWPVYPLRQDVIEKFGDKWTEAGNLIGNGPFTLKEWVHQDHFTLEANPKYWGKKPSLQTLVLRIMPDENAALLAWRNGELDFVPVPVGNERAILADASLKDSIVRFNELTVFAYQFNVTRPPFDNKLVRQALTTAVDRDSFIDKVRSGVGKPALSWLPPGLPGYDPNLGQQYKFNPARAKELLAQAGFPDGRGLPSITFSYADTTGNRVIAQFLQGQMKDNLGIDIKLDPQEPRAFRQFLTANKHQWAFLGWGADYPDPENFLPGLFGTGAGNNHTLYSNAEFDRLTKAASSELDTAKRIQLLQQAHKLVVDDAAVTPVFYRERFWLKSAKVLNLKVTAMDGQTPGDFFFAEVAKAK